MDRTAAIFDALPSRARISLPELLAAASFFPPTTAQAGRRSILV